MLEDLLVKHRDSVLQKWSDFVIDSYHADSRTFLKTHLDKFTNPVGASISEGLEGLYDGLAHGADFASEEFLKSLDRIVRVRAVQEFTPSQALGFIFLIKKAVRKSLAAELREPALAEELLTWESKIDRLALLSFDLYLQCRETIFEIRCNEVKNSTARVWERICRKYGVSYECPEPRENDNSPSKPR
jgi:hypothetical protein